MKLIDIMHKASAQMGKLYMGACSVVSINPNKISDPLIRMNEDDYMGGTLFIANQSYTITDSSSNGNITITRSLTGDDEDSTFPAIGSRQNYTMTAMDRSTIVNAVNTALLAMGEHTTFIDVDVTATEQREFIIDSDIVPIKISYLHNHYDTGNAFSDTMAWDLSIKDGKAVITFQNRVLPAEVASIRVWYNAPHPTVIKDADPILPDYHMNRLVYESAYWGYFQFLAKEHNSSDRDLLLYQSILQERMTLTNKYPVPRLLHRISLPRN